MYGAHSACFPQFELKRPIGKKHGNVFTYRLDWLHSNIVCHLCVLSNPWRRKGIIIFLFVFTYSNRRRTLQLGEKRKRESRRRKSCCQSAYCAVEKTHRGPRWPSKIRSSIDGLFFFFHRENCQPQSCTVTRIPPKTETKKKKFFSTGINYDGTFLSRAPFVGDKTCPFLFFCKGKERKALCWIQHTDLCWRVSKKEEL